MQKQRSAVFFTSTTPAHSCKRAGAFARARLLLQVRSCEFARVCSCKCVHASLLAQVCLCKRACANVVCSRQCFRASFLVHVCACMCRWAGALARCPRGRGHHQRRILARHGGAESMFACVEFDAQGEATDSISLPQLEYNFFSEVRPSTNFEPACFCSLVNSKTTCHGRAIKALSKPMRPMLASFSREAGLSETPKNKLKARRLAAFPPLPPFRCQALTY